jgi:Kef-type K+ transport system membrane component KefB
MSAKAVAGYLAALVLAAGVLWAVLAAGAELASAGLPAPAGRAMGAAGAQGLSTLLLHILVVLGATRVCAAGARAAGQPAVIGEIIGGIVLGPSVLGRFWPEAQAALFPAGSMAALAVLSQVGLVVFMFVVGLELDPAALGRRAHSAVLVSHASIIVPFLLGAALALGLYPRFGPEGASFTAFGLFMGIAMSITAFPVLARIIQERKLGRTELGALALSCAAVDDLTAWCGLAVVVAVARHADPSRALALAAASVLFVALMLLAARPALARLFSSVSPESAARWGASAALLLMLGCALVTETLGIHALFGAFLAGASMPKGPAFREGLVRRFEGLSTLLLLPLFFALSGLRTELALLHDARSWLACGLILVVAVAGKLGGAAAAARLSGGAWGESLALGALMNARGLVELVVLNIGYELGVISRPVFTMMVVMALVTTLMAGPLLERLVPDLLRAADPDRRPPRLRA